MKWKLEDWIWSIFFGSISIYLLKDPVIISFKKIQNYFFQENTELIDFTVRKNLNKILKSFYNNGNFYSCSYDNKSYVTDHGFTDDIDSLTMKLDYDPFNKYRYPIHNEIIIIEDKDKFGIKFSEIYYRFDFQSNFILELKEENLYSIRTFSWVTDDGFDYFKKYPDYLNENGDLNWKVIDEYNFPLDYKVDKSNDLTDFPSVTFKNKTLKVNFHDSRIFDFYKCSKFDLISKLEKKEIVKNFLDGYSRFESREEIRKRWEKLKRK